MHFDCGSLMGFLFILIYGFWSYLGIFWFSNVFDRITNKYIVSTAPQRVELNSWWSCLRYRVASLWRRCEPLVCCEIKNIHTRNEVLVGGEMTLIGLSCPVARLKLSETNDYSFLHATFYNTAHKSITVSPHGELFFEFIPIMNLPEWTRRYLIKCARRVSGITSIKHTQKIGRKQTNLRSLWEQVTGMIYTGQPRSTKSPTLDGKEHSNL
jgi:hypothetical protein